MKRNIMPAFMIALLFIACHTGLKPKQTLLTGTNLKSNYIMLQADSAYTLKTPKGAILKIAAGSFKVNSNVKVQLEIKEAYSMQDILLAGLSTESNGKPLLSGGMFYINATANGKAVDLIKPVQVSVPTDIYDNRMQLYKGEIAEDSSLNWVAPQALDTGATAKNLLLGEKIFKANCASCHKPGVDFTGPALAGCRNREPNKEWVYAFMRNTSMMVEKDPYAKSLKQKYGSIQTSFAQLSKYDIKAVLDYCDNYAALNPQQSPEPAKTTPPPDSGKTAAPCGVDTVYYAKPDTSILAIADTFTIFSNDTILYNEEEYKEDLRNGFTDANTNKGMYDFKIKTFGWYNLDFQFEGYRGSTLVKVNVQLQMEFESEMHVYLFCPDKKFLSVAYDHTGNTYWFNKVDNKIPLFINEKAIILAFGSKADKMYYGTATFNVKNDQTIALPIKPTTEAELKSFIEKNSIDGITIDVNKKDYFEIKEIPCNGLATDTAVISKK